MSDVGGVRASSTLALGTESCQPRGVRESRKSPWASRTQTVMKFGFTPLRPQSINHHVDHGKLHKRFGGSNGFFVIDK
jgi:hypothetical protein